MVILIDLNGPENHAFRKEVSDHVDDRWDVLRPKFGITKQSNAESRKMEIKRGFLAQYVVRLNVGLAGIDDGDDSDYSADLITPSGITIDVKTEGINFDFQEEYAGSGGVMRQAKHNFHPRQLYDPNLAKTDIFLVVRMRTGGKFPGSGMRTEKKWKMWICGWVSKKRVINEGVLIPRGGITEQGGSFFAYRGHNVEFYQNALNPVESLQAWFGGLTRDEIERDEAANPDSTMQCTTADAQRIAGDLLARNVISRGQFDSINRAIGLGEARVPPVLHSNHTVRFVRYMVNRGLLSDDTLGRLESVGIVETRPEALDELRRFFQHG